MERGRGKERERRGALLLDNPFSYRASSRLRLDKCSDGCVWGENSRGWLVESWRGDAGTKDMEKERGREREREDEKDHPVSGCIMGGKGKQMNQTGDEIRRLLLTHRNCHKSEELATRKCPGWTIWLKPLCCYSGGHHSAYRCIT